MDISVFASRPRVTGKSSHDAIIVKSVMSISVCARTGPPTRDGAMIRDKKTPELLLHQTPQKDHERGAKTQGSHKVSGTHKAIRPLGLQACLAWLGEDGILKKSPSPAFVKARIPIT